MISITKQQGMQRWDTLPYGIRELLCSFDTVDALNKIYSEEHIPEAARKQFSQVAGYVISGFVKLSDMQSEAQERLPHIDRRIVSAVINRIQGSVLKDHAEEIERIYAPAGESVKAEEIKIPAEKAAAPAFTGPAPKPFFDLAAPRAEGSAPASVPVPPARPAFSSAPVPPAPPPSFLQQRTDVQPLAPKKDFKLEFSAPPAPGRSSGAPLKPAQIEMGLKPPAGGPPAPKSAEVPSSEPRVVHYTQWKTPLVPPSPSGAPNAPAPVSLTNLASGVIPPKLQEKPSGPGRQVPPPQIPSKPSAPPPPPAPAPASKPAGASVPGKQVDTLLAKFAPIREGGGLAGTNPPPQPVSGAPKVVNFTATEQSQGPRIVPQPPAPPQAPAQSK